MAMNSQSLKLLIQAGNPIISMETPDEPRAQRLVREVAQEASLPFSEWSITQGMLPALPEKSQTLVDPGKVLAALRYVKKSEYAAHLSVQGPQPALQRPAGGAISPRSVFFVRCAAVDAGVDRCRAAAAGSPPPDGPLRHGLAGRSGTDGHRPRDTFKTCSAAAFARSNRG